jgi:hypothetical protein
MVSAVALTAVIACGKDEPPPPKAPARPDSSAGEVAQYALMKNSIGWLTDSNVVALATQVNADAQGMSRLELQAWSKEPLRTLATTITRDHARLQFAIDSVASLRRLPSQMPAVAPEMKAPYDSMVMSQAGLPMADRESQFLASVAAEHQRAIVDFSALAGNATDPDLKALLATRAVLMEQTHLAQTRMIGDAIAKADSARLDSLKAAAATRRGARR